MTTLLLYLDPSGADAVYPWALRSPDGKVLRRGTDSLQALPKAGECVAILPWHRTAIHRVRLPSVRRERLQGVLNYAIENENYITVPFLLLFVFGYWVTGLMSLLQGRFAGLSVGSETSAKPFPVGV